MTDIPNTEYITVKRDENGAVDVFVGGKPATTYRGVTIDYIHYVKNIFAWIQGQNPNITELHVLSSKTSGGYAKVGNPSPKHGRCAWCRVKNNDGKLGGWVFDGTHSSASSCAGNCASGCAFSVRANAVFRRAVFENPELKKLGKVDFSKLPKSPIELNGYRIWFEKIAGTKQNKR